MSVRVPFFSQQCKQLELAGWVIVEINVQGSALLRRYSNKKPDSLIFHPVN